MLTKLQAYSAWESAPLLPLSDNGREETDLLQIRNIDGLDPVKATINTSAFGSVDGAAYIGSNVPTRNLVLTIHPNPDWGQWTFESLRRAVYDYFMPKLLTRLVFHSDDIPRWKFTDTSKVVPAIRSPRMSSYWFRSSVRIHISLRLTQPS